MISCKSGKTRKLIGSTFPVLNIHFLTMSSLNILIVYSQGFLCLEISMTAKARLFSYHSNCRNGTFSFAIEIRFKFFLCQPQTQSTAAGFTTNTTHLLIVKFSGQLCSFLSLDRFSNSSRSLTFEHFVQLGEQICLNKH